MRQLSGAGRSFRKRGQQPHRGRSVSQRPGLTASATVFQHLWEWALARPRADVVRSLLSLPVPPEVEALRQSLLEGLMARLLSERPGRLQKVAEALDALEALQQTPHPDEDRLRALASRADRCPIHAAAYVAWLEERCALERVERSTHSPVPTLRPHRTREDCGRTGEGIPGPEGCSPGGSAALSCLAPTSRSFLAMLGLGGCPRWRLPKLSPGIGGVKGQVQPNRSRLTSLPERSVAAQMSCRCRCRIQRVSFNMLALGVPVPEVLCPTIA